MGLFSSKKNQNKRVESESIQDAVDIFKHNTINKTGAKQTDFIFEENIVNNSISIENRTKKGLSLSVNDLNQIHLKILKECKDENTAVELMNIVKRSNKTKFKHDILIPLINLGFFELTLPEKPTSPKQKYRVTGKFVKVIFEK